MRCGRGGSRAAPRLTATVHAGHTPVAGVPHARRARIWPMAHGDAPDRVAPARSAGRGARAIPGSRRPGSCDWRLPLPPSRGNVFAFRERRLSKQCRTTIGAAPCCEPPAGAYTHYTGRQCGSDSTSYMHTRTARAARNPIGRSGATALRYADPPGPRPRIASTTLALSTQRSATHATPRMRHMCAGPQMRMLGQHKKRALGKRLSKQHARAQLTRRANTIGPHDPHASGCSGRGSAPSEKWTAPTPPSECTADSRVRRSCGHSASSSPLRALSASALARSPASEQASGPGAPR